MKICAKKIIENKWFFPLLLTAVIIIYFWKMIFSGYLISGIDTIVQNFPFKHFLAENLNKGVMPLWCGQIGSGCPLYAEGQASFFYPLNFLFLLFPEDVSFNLILVFSVLTMALSMYFYCRLIGLERFSSLFASIVFTFGSFTALHLDNSNLIYAAGWMSVCILFIELFFRRRNALYILFAGLIFSFQILAGFPQITCYSFLFYSAYFIFRLIISARPVMKPLAAAVIAVAIGAGIGGVQLLPTMKLAEVSSYKKVGFYPSHPKEMLTFINPYIFGNPSKKDYAGNPVLFSLECHYIGIVPIVMIFLAFPLLIRGRFVSFFSLAALFSLILIYYQPVFFFFSKFVPGFGLFRFPQRLYLIVQFSLAVLAGFGMQKIRKNILKISLIALSAADLFIFGSSIQSLTKTHEVMKTPEAVRFLKKDESLYRIFTFKYFETHIMLFKKSVALETKLPHGAFMEMLSPDTNLLWGMDSACLYFSLYLKRFVKFSQFIDSQIEMRPSCAVVSETAVQLLGMQNVKYIISAIPLESAFLKPVRVIENPPWMDVSVYKNLKCLPRIFMVGKAVVLNDISKMGKALTEFNPAHEVILEETPPKTDYGRGKRDISAVTFLRDKVSFNVFSEAGGFIVFSDTYYPGWKAFIDGKETRIYRANYRFKAIQADKGRHFVEFVFKPRDFRFGAALSVFSLVLFLTALYILTKFKGKFYNEVN